MNTGVSSTAHKVVSEEQAGAKKTGQRKSTDGKDKPDEVDIGNPVEFWTAWSERRNLCLKHSETKQGTCTCFEGIGSVM